MNPAGRNGFYREGDKRLLSYVERSGEGAHNDPLKACSGKFRHANWRSAAAEAQRLTLRGQGRCRAYRCPFCDRWHVGHAQPNLAPADQGEVVALVTPVDALPPPPSSRHRDPAQMRPPRTPPSQQDHLRRFAEVARLIGEGTGLGEACKRVGVQRRQFQKALAQERARFGAAAGAADGAAGGQLGVVPKEPRPVARPPTPPSGQQVYVLLYNRWRRRRHDPTWASVPSPRLSNARPVLQLEHLALLTDAERQALFSANTDRQAKA